MQLGCLKLKHQTVCKAVIKLKNGHNRFGVVQAVIQNTQRKMFGNLHVKMNIHGYTGAKKLGKRGLVKNNNRYRTVFGDTPLPFHIRIAVNLL